LFGVPEVKDDEATGAWEEDGIVQIALRALRPRFPELVLLTDVCLCEYMSHGHCGVVVDAGIDNDRSLELLARTAVSHAEAGADISRRDPRGAGGVPGAARGVQRLGRVRDGQGRGARRLARRADGCARVADGDQAGRRRPDRQLLDTRPPRVALTQRSALY